MSQFTKTLIFTVIACCKCGVQFGIAREHEDQLRDTHAWFYCPNGHSQHFPHETEAEKERIRADRAERDLARMTTRHDQMEACCLRERQRFAGLKGHVAKLKKRLAEPQP